MRMAWADRVPAGIKLDFYPDIVDADGLAPAIEQVAGEYSIELDRVVEQDAADGAWNVLIGSERGSICVGLGAARRVFIINIGTDRIGWASGSTEDLSLVVRAADSWRKGATLRELHAEFPFMTYSRLAQGYEDGSPIEARWEEILDAPDLGDIGPLVEAARRNERLGALFPSITHYTMLRLALDHENRDAGEVRISFGSRETYVVDSWWTDVPRRVSTIAEAIDEAVRLLP
jgi:hypothetical protein